MIILTRLNGGEFALNPDLIERADTTPDTVLTLTDGTKYVVAESVREILLRMRDFRAGVIARSRVLEVSDSSITDQPYLPGLGELDSDQQDLDAGEQNGNVHVLRPLRGL